VVEEQGATVAEQNSAISDDEVSEQKGVVEEQPQLGRRRRIDLCF